MNTERRADLRYNFVARRLGALHAVMKKRHDRSSPFARLCEELGVRPNVLLRELHENGFIPGDADPSTLDAQTLRRARDLARQQRMRTRTSKHWVAGYPELVAQWHPTRNGDLFPDEVSFSSHKRVWWQCDAGPDHVWSAQPNKRTAGRGCPFCAGQRVSVTNSLERVRPELAALWHPSRNGIASPRSVTAQSHRAVYWQCGRDASHVWRSAPRATTGCPLCAGKQITNARSLAVRAPAIAGEWHPTRNRSSPTDVFAGSKALAWWRCKRGHVWRAAIKNRALRGQSCPRCVRPSKAGPSGTGSPG